MNTEYYSGKVITVCGGGGFLGSFLVEELLANNAKVRVVQRSSPDERLGHIKGDIDFLAADLTNLDQCQQAVSGADIVFNVAAQVGGIQFNRIHPGKLFYANASMGLQLLEASRLEGVDRFVLTSSTCVYPREAPVPTSEEFGLIGEPEQSNIGYGWAKRAEELAARFYSEEYGMNIAVIRPTNLYGPRDHFDPEISHVIPALIRRTFEVENTLKVWGSGEQTRSFLYVEDAAKALLIAGEQLTISDPLNIGTEEESTIRELVDLIIECSGQEVKPWFDTTAPEGQPRKAADISKSKKLLKWQPSYNLASGIQKTVDWYRFKYQVSNG